LNSTENTKEIKKNPLKKYIKNTSSNSSSIVDYWSEKFDEGRLFKESFIDKFKHG
jgi:hypothetical protein